MNKCCVDVMRYFERRGARSITGSKRFSQNCWKRLFSESNWPNDLSKTLHAIKNHFDIMLKISVILETNMLKFQGHPCSQHKLCVKCLYWLSCWKMRRVNTLMLFQIISRKAISHWSSHDIATRFSCHQCCHSLRHIPCFPLTTIANFMKLFYATNYHMLTHDHCHTVIPYCSLSAVFSSFYLSKSFGKPRLQHC